MNPTTTSHTEVSHGSKPETNDTQHNRRVSFLCLRPNLPVFSHFSKIPKHLTTPTLPKSQNGLRHQDRNYRRKTLDFIRFFIV